MPTWCRCSPPILFWHWPPFNLYPSSCITCIFFVDSHWWVPLWVQHPTIYMPFRQIIMYILQCPHDIHVHLFCFDLNKFLLRSRTATCPTLNCRRGTSLFRQELIISRGAEGPGREILQRPPSVRLLSPAAPKARDGRYCNAPRPSVCPSVRPSVRHV